MTTIVNNFPELRRSILADVREDVMTDVATIASTRVREVAIRHLKRLSPFSTEETHVTSGHDDETPIARGWVENLSVMRGRMSADAPVANISEHIDFQRDGIKGGYTIEKPGRAALYFWIGPPLKWLVRSPDSFYFGSQGGFATVQKVERKNDVQPWGESDFVKRAAREGMPEMRSEFVKAMLAESMPLTRYFFGA